MAEGGPGVLPGYSFWGMLWRYALLGPLLGGVLVLLSMWVTEPKLVGSGLGVLVPFVLLFAFPYGLLSALFAGVAHALMLRRASVWARVGVSMGAGAAGFALTVWLLGNQRAREGDLLQWLGVLALPVLSAGILALWLERPGLARCWRTGRSPFRERD